MPQKPHRVCATCRRAVPPGPCPHCLTDQRRRSDRERGTSAERGYDHQWQLDRADYLKANPWCVKCGQPATVADHYPHTRRELVEAGVTDPDAWHRLRPLCASCHNRHTARTSPGGWYRAMLDRKG